MNLLSYHIRPLNVCSIALIVTAFVVLVFSFSKIQQDPSTHFLIDSAPASWIIEDRDYNLVTNPLEEKTTAFRTEFQSDQQTSVQLQINGFKRIKVFLDAEQVFESESSEEWKTDYVFEIDRIESGAHQLLVEVTNRNGPPAMRLKSDQLALYSGSDWFAESESGNWRPVRLASETTAPAISSQFSSVLAAFTATLPLGLISLTFSFLLYWQREKITLVDPVGLLRWVVLGLWSALAANNLFFIDMMGFDYPDHIDYVRYIADNGALPLADQGLQMFQSPLFYVISAAFFKVFNLVLDESSSLQLLKLLPLLFGIATVELCYRCARLLYPQNTELQCLFFILAAFMPMNLYMSQYFGNEILLGTLTTVVIYLFIKWLKNSDLITSTRQHFIMGGVLGLALLAKVTAVLLLLPLFAVFAVHNQVNQTQVLWTTVMRIGLVILLVSGWYFIRNWLELGSPFVGGWEPGRGFGWWQDPGYRFASDFFVFGQALTHPIYAATNGFWDSIYSTFWLDGLLGSQADFSERPPWSYNHVLASAWLSLIPGAAIVAGVFITLRNSLRENNLIEYFSVICIFTYGAAILYMYLTLPVYSTAKTTYAMGLIPCFAMMGAVGIRFLFDKLSGIRPAVTGGIVWWAANSYLGYFALFPG